jgi:uncharacterized Fe-S center protein
LFIKSRGLEIIIFCITKESVKIFEAKTKPTNYLKCFNMKSDVFYLNARSVSELASMSSVKSKVVLGEIGLDGYLKPGMKTCIKTHFGALENTRYIRPAYTRALVDHVKSIGVTDVFVAESCGAGLPRGKGGDGEYAGRSSEEEYLECAKRHGFTAESMGAPVTMLDGPLGLDWFHQKIKGKYFKGSWSRGSCSTSIA